MNPEPHTCQLPTDPRERARARILVGLKSGPRTPSEISLWYLRSSPYERAEARDGLLSELLAEGRIIASYEPAGHRLVPTLTYRLAPKAEVLRP